MDGAELISKCLAEATKVIKQVRPEHMANVTPENEANVRDLLQHMQRTVEAVPNTLEGQFAEAMEMDDEREPDDDYDVAIAWQTAVDSAEAASEQVDADETIFVNGRELNIDDYLREVSGDLLIHTWDLGKSIGIPVRIEAALAAEVYEHTIHHKQELKSQGILSNSLDVPDSASIQGKLLALFGRPSDWRAPARG